VNKVLVLGAGLVARPLVAYLLDRGFQVTVADLFVTKAEALIGGHENGTAVSWSAGDDEALRQMVSEHDLAASLLPPEYHVQVGIACVESTKHLVTTSYVSDAMKALDGQARARGLVFLNEVGLDPGIDHMSAMRVIHGVATRGGKVVSFRSTTGALPAFESNNNPFAYKFSWSPKGVLQASKSACRWLQDGEILEFPGERLFENYTIQDVPGVGSFENYPNRDSLPYKDVYGLDDAHTVYRGTFRMTGWCETMRKISALGWLGERPLAGFAGSTYGDLTRHLVGASPDEDLTLATARYLDLAPYATVIKRLEWLGLFGDRSLPAQRDNPLNCLHAITYDKMALGADERDMIVMHHEFLAEFRGREEYITSTLVELGAVRPDTAIARTVGLPSAIAVRMILEGKITKPGVHVPVHPEIYGPILDELADIGIGFEEKTTVL